MAPEALPGTGAAPRLIMEQAPQGTVPSCPHKPCHHGPLGDPKFRVSCWSSLHVPRTVSVLCPCMRCHADPDWVLSSATGQMTRPHRVGTAFRSLGPGVGGFWGYLGHFSLPTAQHHL